MSANKPKNNNDVILRDHTYDGIEEFDQKMPNWWLFTLYIMIVAFVVYWLAYYQLPFGMKSDTEKIDLAIAKLDQERDAQLSEMLASMSNEGLFEMSQQADAITAGKTVFESKCIACHGADLTAMMGSLKLPGENLVDQTWKYGGRPLDIMHLITEGSPDVTKGMIAWKTQLSPTDIAKVAAYILSQQPDTYDPATAPARPESL